MKRRITYALLQAAAMAGPYSVYAGTLPMGAQVTHGTASVDTPSASQLTIDQSTNRAVLRWDSFDIGSGAGVTFNQPSGSAATLNIVDSATSSTLSGAMTANGAVFLINPHGVTITPTGSVDTGGAFVASSLSVSDSAFMDGGNLFQFNGNGGAISNAGEIRASDVLLLGSRVDNLGDILAPMGRVALGSASQATLDLSGDGFLQVLAPATVGGSDALVSNSGSISADGGLVQLSAATVRDAMREAVNMPGSVRARSVSGQDGAIVFHGGEGGTVTADGSVDTGINTGGSVTLSGAVVDADFSEYTVGAGGHLSLSADNIGISHNGINTGGWTSIIEGVLDSQIGNLLRAGSHVTLQANNHITWTGGLVMGASELTPASGGQAGNLHLLAGDSVSLGGAFSSVNGDWTVTATSTIRMFEGGEWSQFVNNNGHLTLELVDGGGSADSIELPTRYSGDALTARIDPDIANYDEVDIRVRGDLGVGGDITLSGHLRNIGEGSELRTLSGARVNWTTENTGGRLAGGLLRFVEGGTVTRFGRGGYGTTGPGVDAMRLELGSGGTVSRIYGDAEPDQAALGDLLLSVAAHNTVSQEDNAVDQWGDPLQGVPATGIPMGEILADGSITVSGPGVMADVGTNYQLTLAATEELAFKELVTESSADCCGDTYVSGAAGAYWIDLRDNTPSGSTLSLDITPRPVTASFLDPSYTYGSPEAAVSLSGVVNGDVIVPTGTLGGQAYTFESMTGGFGFYDRLDVGSHNYAVNGITGARSTNYQFDAVTSGTGTVNIAQRPVNYSILSSSWIYGSAPSFSSFLQGLLDGDDVQGVVNLVGSAGEVELIERLPVGIYESELTGLVGADAGNYAFVENTTFQATHEVLPKPVTWHISDVTSVYGTLADTGTATLDGVLSSDQVSAAAVWSNPLQVNSPVGNYQLRVNSLGGSDAGNYVIADSGHSFGTLNITPRPLTWVTPDGTNVYGTLPVPTTPVLNDVLDGDEVTAVSALYTAIGHLVRELSIQTPAGSYTVRATGLEGADSGNYQLASSGNVAGNYEITPKPLGWALGTINRAYGDALSLPSQATFTGLVGDDVLGSEVGVFDGEQPVDTSTGRLPVGEYTLRPVALTGLAAANYALTDTGNSPGTLRINPRLLNWTLGSASNVYGDTLSISDYSFNGLLSGDVVTPVISAHNSSTNTYTSRPDVGTWSAHVTDLQGADAANYALPTLSAGGNTPGQLTITPRPLIYQGSTQREYGEHFSPDLTPINLLAGDDVPLLEYAVLNNSGQTIGTYFGHWPTVFNDGNRINVGTYTIQPLSLLRSGIQPLNYKLQLHSATQQPTSAGIIHITPRQLTGSVTLNAPSVGGNLYETDYLVFGPEGSQGSVLRVNSALNGVLPGDEVSLRLNTSHRPVSSQGYYNAGRYSWTSSGLDGSDAGNYTLASSGTLASLIINPTTILLQAWPQEAVYGDTRDYELEVAPRYDVLGVTRDAAEAAFDAGYISIAPGSYGVVVPGWGVVVTLPRDLPAGSYATWGSDAMLTGPDAENFRTEFRGFDFTVTRRPLEVITRNPQLVYGDELNLSMLFAFGNVIPGDDVRLDDDVGFTVRYRDSNAYTSFAPGSLLNAGEYSVPIQSYLVVGEQASNYSVPDVYSDLSIDRRQLSVDVDETPIYGDVDYGITLEGIVPSEQAWFDDNVDVNISLTDSADVTYTDGDQPGVGEYTLNVRLSSRFGQSVSDHWSANYQWQDTFTLDIQPRPVWVSLSNTSLVYGTDRPMPFDFSLYLGSGQIIDPDSGRPGLLPGDELIADFDIEGFTTTGQFSRIIHDTAYTYDEYLPAGDYAIYFRGLGGADAGNYRLLNPNFWDELEITPKTLVFSDTASSLTTVYGDAIRLAGLDGILPNDDVAISMQRNGGSVTAIIEDGGVFDTSAPSVGEYDYALDALTGADSANYRLASPLLTSATINRRPILYAIENVIGQYGNFAGCENPFVPELCNLSHDSSGNAYADIWAPLELGPVHFFNWIEGDDIRADIGLVDPADGRVLTLDDKPTPGTYLQVVTTLVGNDADNYIIAESGNAPGVLTMTPRWVGWTTYGGFYSWDTGIVSAGSENEEAVANPARASLFTPGASRGVDPEHRAELQPVVEIFLNGDLSAPHWVSDYDPTEIDTWANSPRGVYTVAVTDLEGPYAEYYRPLPPAFVGGQSGNVGFMIVTSLGDFDAEELDPSLVASRQRQWDEFHDRIFNRNDDTGTPDFDSPDDTPDAGVDSTASGTTGNTVSEPTGGSSSSDNLSVQPDAYVTTLAEYGVTGVTLNAGTGAQVEVNYQVGQGYVMVGADVDASGRLQFSYAGLEGAGSVAAGVTARSGIDGSLGDIGAGSVSAGVEAGAFAKGSFSYGYQDGQFSYRQEAMTGAGGRASAQAGISGQYGSADVGAAVYPPGTLGAGIGGGAGFDDGSLTFNLRFSLAIGVVGGSFDLSGAIDLEKIASGFVDVVNFAARTVEEIGCAIGIANCSSPSPAQRLEMELDKGREILQMASLDLRSSPLERFALLASAGEWGYSALHNENATDDERRMYQDNAAFYNEFVAMQQELQTWHDTQEQLKDQFETALREGDSRTAVRAMTNMTVAHNMDDLMASLNERGRALGVGVTVVNGEVQFVERRG